MSTGGTPYQPIPPQNPMFNSVAHTQAGMPHITAHLLAEYREWVNQANLTRQGQGQTPVDPEEQIRAAQPLLDFFENYLKVNRPVQNFPVDMNVGMMLSNNKRICISPGIEGIQGSMQEDSGAIGITDGQSQPGQEGVIEVNDQRRV
jgi:hypothetical protein